MVRMAREATWTVSDGCTVDQYNRAFQGVLDDICECGIPDRLDLSTDRGDAFRSWKERWDDFYLLSGIVVMEPKAQMAALRSCLTDDTNRVMRNLPLAEEDR